MDPLVSAIVGHLVGDYLLQNDWMALNKKDRTPRGSLACAVHAGLWTISVCAFTGWWLPTVVFFLWYSHYLQDRSQFVRWWMRKIGQCKFAEYPLAPWSVIVVDNVWHILVLYLVARLYEFTGALTTLLS